MIHSPLIEGVLSLLNEGDLIRGLTRNGIDALLLLRTESGAHRVIQVKARTVDLNGVADRCARDIGKKDHLRAGACRRILAGLVKAIKESLVTAQLNHLTNRRADGVIVLRIVCKEGIIHCIEVGELAAILLSVLKELTQLARLVILNNADVINADLLSAARSGKTQRLIVGSILGPELLTVTDEVRCKELTVNISVCLDRILALYSRQTVVLHLLMLTADLNDESEVMPYAGRGIKRDAARQRASRDLGRTVLVRIGKVHIVQSAATAVTGVPADEDVLHLRPVLSHKVILGDDVLVTGTEVRVRTGVNKLDREIIVTRLRYGGGGASLRAAGGCDSPRSVILVDDSRGRRRCRRGGSDRSQTYEHCNQHGHD